MTDLNQCLRLNPTNDAAYKTRAAIHGSKGEWYEAISDWDQGLRLNPNDSLNALALASRGWAHFMTSQFDKALHDYRDALQRNPTNDSALNNFAWLRATCPSAEMRNGKEAVELATKACELTNWEKWDWIDTLAAAFAEAGDFKNAVKYQKQAMEMCSITESYREQMQRCLSLYEHQKPNHEGQKQ
jgi:tetratricopeptide (TPR) repeat protein